MGWSLQAGRLASFCSVLGSMGHPQALKKGARFLLTTLEKVSAYVFILPLLLLGTPVMLWYSLNTCLNASQPNVSWSW